MGKADRPFVDLHVHTWYSDSSLSPRQVVEEAIRSRVGVFAVADHEGFEGSVQAGQLAKDAGLLCIPAAELECTWEGVQLHILSYGADPSDPRLMGLAARNREILDGMSDTLIQRMIPEHPKLSLEGFRAFSHDRSLGGWKGLHYLHSMGVTRTPKEGAHLYARYDVLYENAGFPDLSTLLDAIHGAGGKAVLAHPGYTLKALDEDEMEHRVRELIDWGLDGLECYYPLHEDKMTHSFRSLCLEKDLLITAGSDCHGSFGRTRVGEMDITLDQIRLEGLPNWPPGKGG